MKIVIPLKNIDSQIRAEQACTECGAASVCVLQRFDLVQDPPLAQPLPPMPSGSQLYRQGDPLRGLFIVRAGAVRATRITPDGTEQITGFHLPGDLFGFEGLVEGNHAESALTLATTTVCEISRATLTSSVLPACALMALTAELVEEKSWLLSVVTRSADARVAALLLRLSGRFTRRGLSGTEFQLPMARTDIANYLNLTHETVSRVFARLTAAGLVEAHRRSVSISDLSGLSALAVQSAPAPLTATRSPLHSASRRATTQSISRAA